MGSPEALFAFCDYGYLEKLFPTAFRLRGIGFTRTTDRIVTMATPFMVASLYSLYSIMGVVALVVGSLCAAFVAVYFWGIETRNRSLERLEEADVENVSLVLSGSRYS